MKKNNELFNKNEGMTIEGSTIEERHEIWKLLFEKNLIYNQCKSLEIDTIILNKQSFYFDGKSDKFVIEFISMPAVNVPFEEFKNRLSQL